MEAMEETLVKAVEKYWWERSNLVVRALVHQKNKIAMVGFSPPYGVKNVEENFCHFSVISHGLWLPI